MGEMTIKQLEQEYFSNINLEESLIFGGSMGQSSGGVTALSISDNGKLIAEAISNGSILIYDTEFFQLIRLF